MMPTTTAAAVLAALYASYCPSTSSLSLSSFHGSSISTAYNNFGNNAVAHSPSQTRGVITMRKQKASDRRTRRMQRGQTQQQDLSALSAEDIIKPLLQNTFTTSPMANASWKHKSVLPLGATSAEQRTKPTPSGGRGRSRKRSMLYNSLASYQNTFLSLLTEEYKAEEEEVVSRIKNSIDDPLKLEEAGYALFDMYPERRGNLYTEEVYRFTKSNDATTTFEQTKISNKFGSNDVIMLTLQPKGSGDFFDKRTLPTNNEAVCTEARVLSTGPTYVDIVLPGGLFEKTFGPAPNNAGTSGRGDPKMRLRIDKFFSNIPYVRMVSALSQTTSIPDRSAKSSLTTSSETTSNSEPKQKKAPSNDSPYSKICMDELLREAILSTFAFNDPNNIMFHNADAFDLGQLARNLSRPPLPDSPKFADEVLSYIRSNPRGLFVNEFNEPQLTAINAALTRRLTLVQGPPGTGKTTVGSAIGFGFVHQCRSISSHTKVLACAFSNVGADNLAESLLRLGLKVVRVGKPSAVSPSLWDHTLEAAIDKDPDAQKAMKDAAWATSQLSTNKNSAGRKKGESFKSRGSYLSEKSKREVATAAVKASIDASNIAATKALREADVIVCTSTGAADSRLLKACGIYDTDDEDDLLEDGRLGNGNKRKMLKKVKNAFGDGRRNAPDNLPPLTLPFVIIDEACQSVEPASLIPLVSTNSCRSLVLLGDPCQLPPTVKSNPNSQLSVSLMERLAATLPAPVIMTARTDKGIKKDNTFLASKPTKQAVSLLRSIESSSGKYDQQRPVTYRKQFAGSLLLSVQHRMHPSISAFSSAIFYNELLSTPSDLGQCRLFPQELKEILPIDEEHFGVRFIDVGGRNNERRSGSSTSTTVDKSSSLSLSGREKNTSYRNEAEAYQTIELIKQMLIKRRGDLPSTIGVVTPYNGQVELIKSLMSSDEELQKIFNSRGSNPVEVNSVDGYQGRERDVIIFNTVRSNRHGNIGFLKDWRRMNVALTRARSGLVVIGDMETLENSNNKHWAAFGKWCKSCNILCEPL